MLIESIFESSGSGHRSKQHLLDVLPGHAIPPRRHYPRQLDCGEEGRSHDQFRLKFGHRTDDCEHRLAMAVEVSIRFPK